MLKSQNDLDDFPYYDPMVKRDAKMSEVWIASMSAFIQNLQGYLSQYGIFAPQVTTAQRDTIQSPINGQIIYNTTTNKFQGYENGSWQNLI